MSFRRGIKRPLTVAHAVRCSSTMDIVNSSACGVEADCIAMLLGVFGDLPERCNSGALR